MLLVTCSRLLAKHGYEPSAAGHAAYGNLHFVMIAQLSEDASRKQYDAFMHDLVELVVDKYDGSLKAEHGTGINMAPFVRREWGDKLTDLMWRAKHLLDPHGILAPNVLLSHDPHDSPEEPQDHSSDRRRSFRFSLH